MQVNKFAFKLINFIFIFSLLFQSCVGHKELISFNKEGVNSGRPSVDSLGSQINLPQYKPYSIQPFDQLLIKINAFEGSTEEFISRGFTNEGKVGSQVEQYDPAAIYFNSYNVTDSGYIYLPILEKVKVTGLTTTELKLKLDEAYKPYLKFAASDVKLANLRVTVLGEVETPGVQNLYNTQVTLFDAISMAGDFTDFGNRKNVKLIRKTKTGTKTVHLNLTKTDFLSTEYFYVQPYDIIYVEPLKAKSFDVSSQSIGVVLSAISIAAIIVNIIVANQGNN